MKFRLQKTKTELGQGVFIVYPKGYDYGRGFSTIEGAFDYIKSILKNYE